MADGDSAASGGLLVILGIIVAVILGVVFFRGGFGHEDKTADISITIPSSDSK